VDRSGEEAGRAGTLNHARSGAIGRRGRRR
jgi:hypothetical protein